MQLIAPDKAKPELACGKDLSRSAFLHPYLEVDKPVKGKPLTGRLSMTDTYKLVTLPVTFDDDEKPTNGPIPKEAFAAVRKSKFPMKVMEDTIHIFDPPGTRLARPEDVSFPKVDQLMPDEDNISSFHVGINASFLKQAADALGSETVVLEFVIARSPQVEATLPGGEAYLLPANQRAIRVRPLQHVAGNGSKVQDGPLALMMPIRLAGE